MVGSRLDAKTVADMIAVAMTAVASAISLTIAAPIIAAVAIAAMKIAAMKIADMVETGVTAAITATPEIGETTGVLMTASDSTDETATAISVATVTIVVVVVLIARVILAMAVGPTIVVAADSMIAHHVVLMIVSKAISKNETIAVSKTAATVASIVTRTGG